MFFNKQNSHRKTVSNNSATQLAPSSQRLFNQLSSFQFLSKQFNKPNQSYQALKFNDNEQKRTRTEGNEQQSVSPPPNTHDIIKNLLAQKNNDIRRYQNDHQKSNSNGKQSPAVVKTSLAYQIKNRAVNTLPIYKSDDLHQLIKSSKKKKKKVNSQGSMADHIYFTQRGNEIVPKHQNNYSSLLEYYKEKLQTKSLQKTLTLSQFKEKLKSFKQETLKKQKKPINDESMTNKKHLNVQFYEDSGKRIRTENSYQDVTHLSIKEQSDEEKKEFNIEKKLDQMQKEIHELKQKSDILELQNKVLFERLNHINTEKEESNQERFSLLFKLDQMIEMQKKQEENLSFFKQIFCQQQINRRIKTDTNSKSKISHYYQKTNYTDEQESRYNTKSEHQS